MSAAGEPPVVAAAEPPKKKKTGLIAAIIAVVIIAMGVGGYFIYQNHPSTELAKLRTQIAATIEAKDYKGAIDLIEQAREFAPEDKDLRKQYVSCREEILYSRYDTWEYEEFIEEADQLIKDYPEAAAELDPLIMHSYEILAHDAIDEEGLPAMQALKDKLTELTSSGRFNFGSTISWLGDTIRSEFISAGGSARMLAPSAEVVEYHYPLYSKPDETGKKLGMYNYKSHFFFYYGEYDGNLRQGNGIWICADNLKTSNSYREYWEYANSDAEQLEQGTAEVKAGVYNGKVVLTYNNSDPLTGHFTNGLPKVIMTTDPNGKETNVVLISEDGKSGYSIPDVSRPQGIYGFY